MVFVSSVYTSAATNPFPRFKLHLRSKVGSGKNVTKDIPPLPLNKIVVEVFADFLEYLFNCAADYIKETHATGPTFWESIKNDIDFVLSHPNGWEGTQQQEMRRAAVLAKLISDTPNGHAKLSFVTEGEASLHFSIQNGLPPGAMKVDIKFYLELRPTSNVDFAETI
jgi:hypothetical protein